VPNGWLLGPTDALGVPARAPDKREDVFGLACLAYEMLTGRHPYNGNTAQEAYRAGLEAAPIEGMPARQWRALSNALAVHRDDRTPNVAQFLEEFGVTGIQKLRAVVAAGNEPRRAHAAPEPAPVQASAPAYAPVPAYAPAPSYPPRVLAERTLPSVPQRRGAVGTLAVLIAVIGLGAAAWYYQEPLRGFATDLMATVETEMARSRAADDRAAGATGASEPLAEAPAVTDDPPATVLAQGATAPEVKESAPPEAAGAVASGAATPSPETTANEAAVATTAPAAPQPAPAPFEPAKVEPTLAVAPPAAAAGPTRFAFQQHVVAVREGDVAARILIRRSGDLSGTAEVSWWTTEGTAVADRDYADLGARIERFAPGEASRTIYVPLTNDAVAEPARSFGVLLGRGGDAADEMRVDIVDDD
jgi:hypothetical protein